MSKSATLPDYQARIVPALHRIQHEFGYLRRESLEETAKLLQVPLHRLQAVASFFPHFRLTPPKKVTVHVCRDMACHLGGGDRIIKELEAKVGPNVEVKGVSCLGRCDRAVAVAINTADGEHDDYYLRRSTPELLEIIEAYQTGNPPRPDKDADEGYVAANFTINPYGPNPSDYAGVVKAVSVRNTALAVATKYLVTQPGWTPARVEQFQVAALARRQAEDCPDPLVGQALTAWATASDWAKDKKIGDWSDQILEEIEAAELRGLGGAGIPSKQKIKDVRDAIRKARKRQTDSRGFIVVNGDESEPGTFKDREILLHMPYVVIEGVILAGLMTEATQGFIYIRHEYGEQIEACRAEIRRAEQLGLCGKNASVLGRPFPVEVFVSPGGYICGEQSALIEAMSDRRGEPRNLPPKLETNGLEDLPTIVSNVETYSWIPYIWIKGGKTYAGLGTNGWKGRRLFSISGDVKRPGVYEVPMGLTLRDLVFGEQYCQGIAGDRKLKAFAPSGPSGGFLPPKLKIRLPKYPEVPKEEAKEAKDKKAWKSWDAWEKFANRHGIDPKTKVPELDLMDLELELDIFRTYSPTQALGAGLVVYAEGRDMLEQALNSVEFYRNESCGKCVPCRLGSQKLVSLTSRLLQGEIGGDRWDKELAPLFKEMDEAIVQASICGLGRSVPVPLRTVIDFFKGDLVGHLQTAPVAATSRT